MSPSAIYSKSGKGVQEASGKTSLLSRADRAVLSAIDGKLTVAEVADKIGKPFDGKFEQLIEQLDKDGFVRQVSPGSPAASPAKPGAAKPAAAPAKPAAPAAKGEDLDFTIAMPSPKAAAPKPAAAPPAPPVAPHMAQSNAAAFARAREEAEEKAAKERERIKAEAEAKMRAEMEAKARSEAEVKAKSDAEARVRAEAEAKVKAARDAAVKAAAEAKAKADEEARKVREEAEAKLAAERARAREAEEKARREAEEAKRQAEEAKRKAEEEARKAREEAERLRKEAEEAKRQAEEAKRKAEEEARRVREEAERKAKEEAERRRKEEEARKAREEQERREREAREKAEREAREKKEREAREAHEQQERAEKERRAREKAEREQREREEEQREAQEKAARKAREREEEEREERERAERKAREKADREREDEEREAAEIGRKARERAERDEREKAERAEAQKTAAAAKKPESFGDSLLADLDSFSQREDDDRKAKEEAARKEKEAAARRAKEEEERRAREEAEREAQEKKRAEEERRRKEEEARAREEEERRRREEEEREREKQEAERRRKARAKDDAKAAAPGDDDIGVSDDDLDMDEVKKDEAALSKESRRSAREREERERQAKKDAKAEAKRAAREAKEKDRDKDRDRDEKRSRREEPPPPPQFRRPRKWGKTVATLLFVVLIAGIGVIHVMPISTAEYENAASQAVGRPVKISSANLSLYSGVLLKFDGVSIGEAKVAKVRAFPEVGSLFNPKKAFTRIELDGVTVPQASIGELFGAKVRGENFTVGRVNAKNVKLAGPLQFPPMEIDLAIGQDGGVTSTSLRGADGLAGKLVPKNANEMDVEVVAHSFSIPVVPDMTLSGFALKGVATRDGMRIESWGGSSLDGAVAGSATVRWGAGNWAMEGVMTVRGINAAVFAPALLSEGKAEGTGRFSFSDPDPMSFLSKGRIEGTYTVHKGVLGSFDLSRAITTGGRQVGGRTPFTGLSGQGVFDKGAVALRNVSFGAGALNAGASADISPEGTLSGRIVADVRTPSQTLRATLNLGGTVKDPQVRN